MQASIRSTCLGALAALCAAQGSPAVASVARISFENIEVAFVDLDPDDGVVPSFGGVGNAKVYSGIEFCTDGVCPGFPEFQLYETASLLRPAAQPQVLHPVGRPWASHFAGPDYFGTGVQSDADSHGFDGGFPIGFYRSNLGGSAVAQLSDKSVMTLTGDLVADVDGAGSASASIRILWNLDEFGLGRLSSDTYTVTTPGPGRVSVPVSFTVRNDSPWPVAGEFWFLLDGSGIATPVPEPATAALAGAGGLLMAAAARGRRRHAGRAEG